MADVLGLSDISSKDTGKGKQLKTGNLKRSYNMPSPKSCAQKYKRGSKEYKDCVSYKKSERKVSREKKRKASSERRQELKKKVVDVLRSPVLNPISTAVKKRRTIKEIKKTKPRKMKIRKRPTRISPKKLTKKKGY